MTKAPEARPNPQTVHIASVGKVRFFKDESCGEHNRDWIVAYV